MAFYAGWASPKQSFDLKTKNRQSKIKQTKTEDKHETIVKRSKMA